MKIAIHNRKGSFSEYWIEYCKDKGIPFKEVNCYQTDIIDQLVDCDCLMWNFHHEIFIDPKLARQLLFSLQTAGKTVFPDINTMWHYDDKVGQKYLLEAIKAPHIPTYVFYYKEDAIQWINQTTFPKVSKLSAGASSMNVRLVKNKKHAIKLINTAFSKGFSKTNSIGDLKERWRKIKSGKAGITHFAKGLARMVYPTEFSRIAEKEKNYIYFQDFIPENNFDIRLIVIQDKAYGMKRMVRKGDFRASGSGEFLYDRLDPELIKLAFEVCKKLKLQTIAFDFIYNNNKPLIVEMSYAFGTEGSGKCPGYWDKDLNWHEGIFNPFGWMVDMVVSEPND